MRLARILILPFFASLPLLAGSIFGHVRVSGSSDCESLHVQLRALDSERVIPLRVDNQCRYGQSDVPAGVYELTAQAHGYYDYVSSSFTITPAAQVLHDPALARIAPPGAGRGLGAFLGFNVGAVIAFVGLLVAVFELRLYFKRPSFEVCAKATEPYCHGADILYHGDPAVGDARFTAYFCRVWVANNGTSDANHVEAFATRLFKEESQPGGGRRFKLFTKFKPVNLRWASSWQITKDPATADVDSLVKRRISTRTGRFLDIGFFVAPPEVDQFIEMAHLPTTQSNQQFRHAQGNVVLFLTVDSIIDDSGGTLGKGKYLLEIVIDCDTIQAERFYLYIEIVDWQPGLPPDMEMRPASDIELRAIHAKPQNRSFWMRIVAMRRRNDTCGLFVP